MGSFLKYGIVEDIETVKRIPLGRFWGVSLLATSLTWLSPFLFFGLHFFLNLVNYRLGLIERLHQAMFFTFAIEIATMIHAIGHILSGKMVHSPMDELLITATRDVNIYHGDQNLVPGMVHLVRSLGGPVLNLILVGLCIAFLPLISPGFWNGFVASLLSTNLFLGLGSFLPLPSVDGEVIWREVLRLIRIKKSSG